MRANPWRPRPATATFEAAYGQAFRLAFLLHGERTTAQEIALEAFSRLRLAVTAQRKRFYYRPRGERSKVELSELHLLQRLVLIASEPYERAGEAAGRSGQEDLVLRFVKHLVRITMKRNSFYVALGLTRVLHDYSTTAAMDLYGLLLADPGENPDGPYYRSRKRVLLAELAERFGARLAVVRGAGGEDRFASQPAGPFADLVRRALAAFAPWGVRCDLPAGWTPERAIPGLDGPARRAPEVDLLRSSAVLVPSTFAALLAALRLPPAADRLSLPALRLEADEEDGPRGGQWEAPELEGEEIAAARAELARRAAARRQPAPVWLAVEVDGRVQGNIKLDGGICAFSLPEGAERIEIFDRTDGGGQEPLALHLLGELGLPSAVPGAARRFARRLATGLRLELEIDSPAASGERTLRVSYLRSPWRRAFGSFGPLGSFGSFGSFGTAPRRARLGFGSALAATAAAALLFLFVVPLPLSPPRLHPPAPVAVGPEGTPSAITRGGRPQGDAAGHETAPGTVVVWLEPPPPKVDRSLAAALAVELSRLQGVAASGDREAADLALRWLPAADGDPVLALVTREGRILWRRRPVAGRSARLQAAAWVREISPYFVDSARPLLRE